MKKTTTIQDIATSLNISRNTVSKALNNHPLPEKTRKLVMDKAIELGYKGLNYMVFQEDSTYKHLNIMLIASTSTTSMSFFLELIKGIEEVTLSKNIKIIQYNPLIFNNLFSNIQETISQHQISGIICIETFYPNIIATLLDLEIPIVFIDFPHKKDFGNHYYDVVSMDSIESVTNLCDELINKYAVTHVGYVGDYLHCQSFYDRFIGMIAALSLNHINYEPEYSFTLEDSFPYGNVDMLSEALDQKKIPELYVCANDFIAISLIQSLKKNGYLVPDDIMVVGFDNIFESSVFQPSITTINVDKKALGKQAVFTLLERIERPDQISRNIQIKTNLIKGSSTMKF